MDKKVVPQGLIDLNDEATAAEQARDAAVKGFFKFQLRNAIFFGKIAVQKRREFWEGIRSLYPELGDDLTYDVFNKTVSRLGS